MKIINETVDVVIAGGGTAGHIAAIQAAREGISVSLIEAASMLGGTMTDGGVVHRLDLDRDRLFAVRARLVKQPGFDACGAGMERKLWTTREWSN